MPGADVWFVANPRGYGHERHNPRRNRTVEVEVENPRLLNPAGLPPVRDALTPCNASVALR